MADKYIIIPEYKPLYAMRYCFGPTHGPLEKPCPTPIDVIGKLLLQTGNEKLSIYEVKVDPVSHKTVGEPIRLTLANYKQPYDKIAMKDLPDNKEVTTKEVDNTPVVISPTQKDEMEDSAIVAPKKEESLVETKTIKEKLDEIPEVEPDELDKQMISDIENTQDDNTLTNIEDIKEELQKTYQTTTISADGVVESYTTETETPKEPVFTSGYIAPVENTVSNDKYVTTASDSSETYKVPVTTDDGTIYVDTGMTESEYKNLSKSKRRELRKKLASNEKDYEV
jgi:hypothetical protein